MGFLFIFYLIFLALYAVIFAVSVYYGSKYSFVGIGVKIPLVIYFLSSVIVVLITISLISNFNWDFDLNNLLGW